jgi:hypothetical protein
MTVNILGTPLSKSGSSTTSVVNLPTGIVAGEKLLLGITKNTNGSISIPEGWNRIGFIQYSFVSQLHVFEKTADGTEGSTVSIVDTKSSRWVTAVFRTDASAIGVVGPFESVNSNSIDCSSVNSTVDGGISLRFAAANAGTVITSTNDVTEPSVKIIEGNTSFGSSDQYLGVSYQDQPTAGATGVSSFAVPSAVNWRSATIMLNPSLNAIVDVDGDNVLVDGQVGATLTVTGFASDITSIKFTTGGYEITASNIAGSGDNYTFDLPDVSAYAIDTAGIPFTSAANTILCEVTDGASVSTLEVAVNPKAGMAIVDVLNAVIGDNSVYEVAPTDDSQNYYDNSAGQVIFPSGTFTTDVTPLTGIVWDIDTGIWEPFTVNVAPTPDPDDGNRKKRKDQLKITRNYYYYLNRFKRS